METPFPWNFLQHLLVPQHCVICGEPAINRDFSQVCRPCLEELRALPEPVCTVCGKPLPGGRYSPADTCAECRSDPPPFDMARAWGSYQGNLRSLLREFKYRGWKPLAGPLGGLLEDVLKRDFPPGFDWIVPVPLHRKRLRGRGYDQALLLARALASRTGIPILLAADRVKDTLPQYGLSASARKENLAGAFALKKDLRVEEASVLVVDDVFTTGSTVSSLCGCLRKNRGISFIGALTVARAIRHGPLN